MSNDEEFNKLWDYVNIEVNNRLDSLEKKLEIYQNKPTVKPSHFSDRYNKLCPYCSGIFKTTKEGDYICSKCSSIFREYLVCIGERVVPK